MHVDKTMPTKENVIVTVTWPNESEKGTKEIKVGNNSWQVASGNTSQVEVTENCTVTARVSNSEEVTSSSITISNIDKANPIVTVVTEGEETIEEGTSNEISSYFTYSANGVAEITSVKYTDTSDGNKNVTNTNTLAVGTHIIKCTVTKETGLEANETKTIIVEASGPVIVSPGDIASKPEKHYGGEVTNYTTPSGDPNVKWRIFYADEENVYLIASDYIHYNYVPTGRKGTTLYKNTNYKLSFNNVYNDYIGASDIKDQRIKKWISYISGNPSEDNINIRAVAFMLDETRWSAKYANTTYAEYAIGGPTLELWCASYKASHPQKYVESKYDETGYKIRWNGGSYNNDVTGVDDSEDLYYIKSSVDKADSMWIASPSADGTNYLMNMYNNGHMNMYYYYSNNRSGIRPIVCLKSEILLEKQSDGTYLIK